jgi:type IV pilus assembly protein PilW
MRSRHGGFTLIEILVAVAIGLIGILVMTQAYLVGENFNRATLGEGGAQTNGLLALFQIERDARMSGYGIASTEALGCGEINWFYEGVYSPNITAGSTLARVTVAPVLITVDATPSVPDRITVMYSNESERVLPAAVANINTAASELGMDGSQGYELRDKVLLVSTSTPGRCTYGEVTVKVPATHRLTLGQEYNPKFNPIGWGSFPTGFGAGDLLINFGAAGPVVRTYSINNGKLRATDGQLESATGGTLLDLIDGIVDLRAQYGKDNGVDNGTVSAPSYTVGDGRLDQYSNTTPANANDWAQVLAVRIGVLARIGNYERPSVSGGNCDATTVAPTWSGGGFPAIDIATATSQDRCYRYRVFETTVPLRNMIWRLS